MYYRSYRALKEGRAIRAKVPRALGNVVGVHRFIASAPPIPLLPVALCYIVEAKVVKVLPNLGLILKGFREGGPEQSKGRGGFREDYNESVRGPSAP